MQHYFIRQLSLMLMLFAILEYRTQSIFINLDRELELWSWSGYIKFSCTNVIYNMYHIFIISWFPKFKNKDFSLVSHDVYYIAVMVARLLWFKLHFREDLNVERHFQFSLKIQRLL